MPIAYTLLTDSIWQHHFRLGQMVVTVDAVNLPSQLTRHPETTKQLAIADQIALTKGDLIDDAGRTAAVSSARGVNSSALIVAGPHVTARALMTDDQAADAQTLRQRFGLTEGELDHSHSNGMQTLSLRYTTPMDWTAFGVWLTLLLARHIDKILRVKGLLNVSALPGPVLINGLQHIAHPPEHLPAWPSDDHTSRIIIIASGIEQRMLRRSLESFMA